MSSYEDKVWFDGERKLDGLCRDVLDALAAGSNVLVLAHFTNTLAIVEASLRARSIEYKSYLPLDLSSLCSRLHGSAGATVWAGVASYFQGRALPASDQSRSSLRILVAEHHPMASRDQSIVDVSKSVSCNPNVVFHSSLTDPVLARFGTDKLGGLMKQLGMNEQDFISHPMISTAIRNGQKKIESKVRQESQTMSGEDWFKYNLR